MAISPHIRRLREHVGHARLLVPSVAVLVWDEQSRLLLVRDADGGRWTTVGGAIELDESPQQAAEREVREEVGIEIVIDALRGVFAGPQFTHTYANGDVASFVAVVYDAHVAHGQARPDGEEVLEARWFAPEAIDAPLTPFTQVLLRAADIGFAAPAAQMVADGATDRLPDCAS